MVFPLNLASIRGVGDDNGKEIQELKLKQDSLSATDDRLDVIWNTIQASAVNSRETIFN